MSRDPRKYEFASTVVDDKEHVKCSQPNSLNSEQITGPDLGAMLSQELAPTGEGVPMYGRRMYLATVRAQTLNPRRANSAWILRCTPRAGFALPTGNSPEPGGV